MAIITIPKKQFEKEIGKLDEKMQNKIAMFGTPIEEITNEELQLEIFPNRPDMLSYHGFKRSFLAFLGKKTGLKSYKVNKPEKNYKVLVDSSVKRIRPYTACAIIKGIKLDSEKIKEIIEIQEKLHLTIGRKRKKLAIGIYPLEKIKLPITLKAIEPDKIKFLPLESKKEMSGLEILQKHPTGKEYSHLLAGKEKFPIFIDAEKNILSMPPIINSELTGKVTEETRDLFVECTGFDLEILKKCLNIIVVSLADMGGTIYQIDIKGIRQKTPDLSTEKMKISLENTNKLLGLKINEKRLKTLIEKMGHNYKKGSVEIPSWRTDILHEVDLIEDIAIAYGYENFEPEIPNISTIGEENQREIIKRKISEILEGLNLIEISNFHLTNKNNQFTNMGISEKKDKNFIEVEESKTDYTILRKDLSHYLLKIFSENVNAEYPQKIFEIGKVFTWKDENSKENEHLSIGISPGNFTEIRQILMYLFKMIGLKIQLKELENPISSFIPGRTAEIILESNEKNKQEAIGIIGEIHPKILQNWKIKMPVALLEINLEKVIKELE